MNLKDIKSVISDLTIPLFRADQLYNWIYVQKVKSLIEMSNLPKGLREQLKKEFTLNPLTIIGETGDKEANTKKYLLECLDGNKIESVLMREGRRNTLCISSQIGCALDCKFCATGTKGIIRNLSAGEIVGQYLLIQKESEKPITNIVFMGMGEPFLNYENVLKAADLINDANGINVGARHITISTAGIIPGIQKFTNEKRRYKLAISLNGSNQDQRKTIMPLSKKYPFNELIEAVRLYHQHTKNFATFEYVLIADINDSIEDAKQLKKVIGGLPCKLNVIPYNEIGGKFSRPIDSQIDKFMDTLKNAPFTVTTRWSKGADINAGCGQLVVRQENQYEI
jgi:23S rRNA (adenine2503-C2)-methyltransferase